MSLLKSLLNKRKKQILPIEAKIRKMRDNEIVDRIDTIEERKMKLKEEGLSVIELESELRGDNAIKNLLEKELERRDKLSQDVFNLQEKTKDGMSDKSKIIPMSEINIPNVNDLEI